jgi:small subunit ribosomal protein S2
MMQPVSMKQLLEAGVHFGHQKRRWNPKMKKYIYTDRNDIYIIDLKKTLKLLREACVIVRDMVAEGGRGLFVGTKKQAREAIEHWAEQCDMNYINNRWLGGMLTNWETIGKRVKRMIELEKMQESGEIDKYSKKEQSRLMRQLHGLQKNLTGMRSLRKLPAFLFVIDPQKEHIAVHEANRLGIPVVAVVDTNCDPDPIDIVVPGNDDAIRAINLVCQKMAESCIDGMIMRVDAGLEAPSYLPEAVRQQVMGTVVDEEPVTETPEAPVVVPQEAPAPVAETVAAAPVPAPAPAPAPVPEAAPVVPEAAPAPRPEPVDPPSVAPPTLG